MNNPDFVFEVLKYIGDEELHDMIWWTVKGEDVHFCINCSDLFFWGSADAEDITPESLPILKQSIEDCKKIEDSSWVYGCNLFASRIRKERPQGACYPSNKDLWPLFDACGPERETGLGNPYKPGDYKKKYKTVEIKDE